MLFDLRSLDNILLAFDSLIWYLNTYKLYIAIFILRFDQQHFYVPVPIWLILSAWNIWHFHLKCSVDTWIYNNCLQQWLMEFIEPAWVLSTSDEFYTYFCVACLHVHRKNYFVNFDDKTCVI